MDDKKSCLKCKIFRFEKRFPLVCKHLYCECCLRKNWEKNLEENITNFSCLDETCEVPIDPSLIKDLLSEEEYEKFKKIIKNPKNAQMIQIEHGENRENIEKSSIIDKNSNLKGVSTVDSSMKDHVISLEKTSLVYLKKCPICDFSMNIEEGCLLLCQNSECAARICRKCLKNMEKNEICDCDEKTQPILPKKRKNSNKCDNFEKIEVIEKVNEKKENPPNEGKYIEKKENPPLEATVHIYSKRENSRKKNTHCLNCKIF